MTSAIPWPDDNPDAWNICELGGLDMPGLATVKVRLSDELDIKKPKGRHGATITRQGYNPAKVTIVLRMWERAQFEAFQQLVTPLRPRVGSGRDAEPLTLVHPKAALWGIRAITIQEITDDNGERGDLYDVTFSCIEHFPPPKIAATKTSTTATNTSIARTGQGNAIASPRPPPSTTGSQP